MQDTNKNSLMVPIYMGDYGSGKKSGKESKNKSSYDKDTERFLRSIGLMPPDEEEDELFRIGSPRSMYTGRAPPGGLDNRLSSIAAPYSMPSSMRSGMGGYNGQMMPQSMQQYSVTKNGRYFESGFSTEISMQKVTADGDRYNLNYRTNNNDPQQNLAYFAAGVFALVNAGGKAGEYQGGGKSDGRGYTGGKGGK